MNDLLRLVDGAGNDPAAILLRSAREDKAARGSKERMRAMLGLVDPVEQRIPVLPKRMPDERVKRSRKIARFIPFQHLVSPARPAATRKLLPVAVAFVQVAAMMAALFVRPVPRIDPATQTASSRRDEPEISFFVPKSTHTESSMFFQAGMTQPVRISGMDPAYPQIALLRGVEGTVIMQCLLTEKGLAENCTILKSPAYLDEAVLSVSSSWRFAPVTWQGRAVPVHYIFKINFKLGLAKSA